MGNAWPVLTVLVIVECWVYFLPVRRSLRDIYCYVAVVPLSRVKASPVVPLNFWDSFYHKFQNPFSDWVWISYTIIHFCSLSVYCSCLMSHFCWVHFSYTLKMLITVKLFTMKVCSKKKVKNILGVEFRVYSRQYCIFCCMSHLHWQRGNGYRIPFHMEEEFITNFMQALVV